MSKRIYILLLMAGLWGCKKEQQPASIITTPVITAVSRTTAQAGDTLRIYGKSLAQKDCHTEVFVNDRPCLVLNAGSDSLVVVVGTQTVSGVVKVTVGQGSLFSSCEGPLISVNGTPVIQKFWPLYGMPGDTVMLITAHFSAVNADNSIYLLGQKLNIVYNNGNDTLLAEVPAAAGVGVFSWQTFLGPLFQNPDTFTMRQKSYPANTVSEWIQQDPAFSYVDTLLHGFDALATNKELFQRYYDSTLLYINSEERKYTIFMTANGYYYAQHISLADYITKIKEKSYLYYPPQLTAIIPGKQLSLSTLQDGDIFKSASTQGIAFPGGDPDLANQVQIMKENGKTYAFVVDIYGGTAPRAQILRTIQIGNATIVETAAELGSLPF